MVMGPVTPAAIPRSSPCPCGSGRRYKECHGAVRNPVEAERTPVRSLYRPKGPDWDHLPESRRDACGQMMENALQLQSAGRDADAERVYCEVLNIAPKTHDALHMLGAITFGRGDLIEAEKLIKEALALRQEYPKIRQNLTLVQDAIKARQGNDIRVICELALPLLPDAVLHREAQGNRAASSHRERAVTAGAPQVQTHLIADFTELAGENGWYARRVASLLSGRSPTLWSLQAPVDAVPDTCRMRAISAVDRQIPVGGVQILFGIDCDLEGWIEQASPDRLLVFGLAAPPGRYLEQLRYLADNGAPPIELIFRSRAEATRFGQVGPVAAPPIELPRRSRAIDAGPSSPRNSFTLGMVAQEERTVRASDDVELLRALAAGACRLSLLAPGRLRFALGGNRDIEFHSRRELPLEAFFARIDGYLHRVPDRWEEGCGLALLGAMARGLPVLCSRDSLYAEYIAHEQSGLLYADENEVLAWAQRLSSDRGWARTIGDGARARAAELFDTTTLSARYAALIDLGPIARPIEWLVLPPPLGPLDWWRRHVPGYGSSRPMQNGRIR